MPTQAKKTGWLYTREAGCQALLLVVISGVLVLLAFPTSINYKIDEVAEHTIRADRGFRMEDRNSTEIQRQEAASAVPPVFLLDDMLSDMLEDEGSTLFRRGRVLTAGDGPKEGADNIKINQEIESFKADFFKLFDVPNKEKTWDFLVRNQFRISIERQVLGLAMEIMGQGLLDRPNPFFGQRQRPASIITASTQAEYSVPVGASLFDQDTATRYINIKSRALRARYSPEEIVLIAALSEGLMQPNMHPDLKETERRIEEAKNAVPTAFFNVRAGEVIVREGSVISAEAMEKIKIMKGSSFGPEKKLRFLGLFIALFVFFSVSFVLAHGGPKQEFRPLPIKEQVLIGLIITVVALLAHSSLMFGASLAPDFDFMDRRTVFYAMPIPAAAMVVAIFFGTRKACFMALFAAVAVAVVTPPGASFLTLLFCYNGGITGAWCLRNMNERSHLIPAAFWVMIVNCLTLLGLTFFTDLQWGRHTINNFCAVAASGVLSGILASGLVPLIEAAFGFTTNLKMLELGNLDRPMLRELMLSAPGTYHHSVIVGAMVEAAAESIGANQHLAKVGAYYHDIGKMKKPLYFVENQTGENRHDTLAPSMSALILIGHVRDGVELARINGLPQGIIDIIEQHHGTSLMAYFYHKAKELRQEGQPEVNEGDYRYPGPRPRSREAGLVMLADICEAATRSLSEPTPIKIKNMVRHLVNQIFSDGQLDDCELKVYEVAEVINTFTNILIGIYHHRVAYPGAKKPVGVPVEEKKDPRTPGVKSETAKEIYGHIPVQSAKSFAH